MPFPGNNRPKAVIQIIEPGSVPHETSGDDTDQDEMVAFINGTLIGVCRFFFPAHVPHEGII